MGLHSYGRMARRLGGARPLRPAARGAPGPHQGAAGGLGARRAAVLRHDEHPLHHRHSHRHLGGGQAQPLLPAAPGRRADHVGLRLGGPPPPALQPVAGRRALARRASRPCAARCPRSPGAPRTSREKIRVELEQRGLLGEPVGIDAIEPAVLFALQREGIQVADGQQLMQQARVIKTRDEITLLNMACSMVDAAYEELYRTMRAGHPRERLRRAGQQGALRDGLGVRRGRQRDLRRALQPPSARVHRPRAASRRSRLLRHPAQLHGLPHLLLPHVRGRPAPRARWSTPTSAAATTWTRRSS